MEDELEQGFDANDSDAREKTCFGEVINWDVDFGEVGGSGGFDDVDDTANGADLPI